MRIIALADIHGHCEALEWLDEPLSQADVVLVGGDITNFGTAEQAAAVVERLGRYGGPVLAVPGNCDPPEVDIWLTQAGINLHGRAVCLDSWWFIGAGGALSGFNAFSNKSGLAPFTKTLQHAYSHCKGTDRLVLVTHQPPLHTALDTVAPGRYAGNRAIRDFIELAQPQLALSGHIHEIIGTDRIGPTTLLNPGPAKQGRWAMIDLEDHHLDIQLFPR